VQPCAIRPQESRPSRRTSSIVGSNRTCAQRPASSSGLVAAVMPPRVQAASRTEFSEVENAANDTRCARRALVCRTGSARAILGAEHNRSFQCTSLLLQHHQLQLKAKPTRRAKGLYGTDLSNRIYAMPMSKVTAHAANPALEMMTIVPPVFSDLTLFCRILLQCW
jgi:hypothetical protein